MTDLKKLPDEEFIKLMKVVVDYDYDLALEIEHLTSVDQVPEKDWDEFVRFYNKYHGIKNPKETKKKRSILSFLPSVIGFCIVVIYFLNIEKSSWARFYEWIGNQQGAIENYTKALDDNPQNSSLYYYNRGVIKQNTGDLQGAIDDYNKAIENDPNLALAYNNRGLAKQSLGDTQSACVDVKKAGSLGHQPIAQWLNSEDGAWCRNMR